jgi:cytochrome c556
MKIVLAAGLLLALGTTLALAGPIEDRQQLMKGIAAATKTGAGLAKGDIPYDPAKAKEVFQTYSANIQKLPALFPDDSKTGGETTASPKIWDDMAGFKDHAAKFDSDAKAALDSTGDQASFARAFGDVTKNCGACHGTYRIKKG